MKLYAGFDLHPSNTYLGIIDEDGKRVFKRKLSPDPGELCAVSHRFGLAVVMIMRVWIILSGSSPIF